jgi:hypothetical protein
MSQRSESHATAGGHDRLRMRALQNTYAVSISCAKETPPMVAYTRKGRLGFRILLYRVPHPSSARVRAIRFVTPTGDRRHIRTAQMGSD